jgi:hypothetical protein
MTMELYRHICFWQTQPASPCEPPQRGSPRSLPVGRCKSHYAYDALHSVTFQSVHQFPVRTIQLHDDRHLPHGMC